MYDRTLSFDRLLDRDNRTLNLRLYSRLYNVLFICYYGVQSNVLVNPKIANLLRLLLVVLPTALPI